jgi:hypothetical protein
LLSVLSAAFACLSLSLSLLSVVSCVSVVSVADDAVAAAVDALVVATLCVVSALMKSNEMKL